MTNSGKPLMAECLKARARLGHTREQVIREWLLPFARRDLGGLSAGDWSNLEYEVFEFVRHGVGDVPSKSGALSVTATSWRGSVSNPTAPTLPTIDEIMEFQKRIKEGLLPLVLKKGEQVSRDHPSLKALLRRGREIPAKLTTVYVNLRPQASGRAWPLEMHVSTEEIGSAWLFGVMQTVAPLAGLIRQCPGCDVIFLADRTHQAYCSHRHQARAFMRAQRRAYREKHGLPTDRPRGRPRKAEAKTASHAAVNAYQKKKTKEVTHGTSTRKRPRPR